MIEGSQQEELLNRISDRTGLEYRSRNGGNRKRSEGLQSCLLFLLDVKELVQFGDLEYLVNLGVNVAEDQPAADTLQFLVECDQFAEGSAGEVLNIAEVQEQLAAVLLFDETEELFADDLNVLLVQNLAIDEVDDRYVPDVLDFQAATARLRRHAQVPPHDEKQPPPAGQRWLKEKQ
jgi:hypothetical protein